jgi:hypothetical protein
VNVQHWFRTIKATPNHHIRTRKEQANLLEKISASKNARELLPADEQPEIAIVNVGCGVAIAETRSKQRREADAVSHCTQSNRNNHKGPSISTKKHIVLDTYSAMSCEHKTSGDGGGVLCLFEKISKRGGVFRCFGSLRDDVEDQSLTK